MRDNTARALLIFAAVFVAALLWLSTQPASHNGPCVRVAHDEVC